MQFFPGWSGFIWIGIYSLAMAGLLLVGMEWQAGLTMILAGSGANVLMGSFAHLIARTDQRHQENQHLSDHIEAIYQDSRQTYGSPRY